MPLFLIYYWLFICNHLIQKLDIFFGLTDYVPPEEWGPEYPIPGTIRPNVPIPTLYADGKHRFYFFRKTEQIVPSQPSY